jgi:hypothetical protein
MFSSLALSAVEFITLHSVASLLFINYASRSFTLVTAQAPDFLSVSS